MQHRRTPRGLRPEERALWHEVARSAQPLPGRPAAPAPTPPAAPPPAAPPAEAGSAPPPRALAALPEDFRIGSRAAGSGTAGRVLTPAEAPLKMDRKAFGRLARGRLTPEARIDLHGRTLAEAQPALARFLFTAHAAGRRLVLVITGKGRPGQDDGPIPHRVGALRHEVPLWLSRPPLAGVVLQVMPAHLRHGGSGAFYVWLRRPK